MLSAYASQLLNRPLYTSTSASTSQRLFYSFTTEDSEGRRMSMVDDDEDPHLQGSDDSDEEDEDELPPGAARSLRMSSVMLSGIRERERDLEAGRITLANSIPGTASMATATGTNSNPIFSLPPPPPTAPQTRRRIEYNDSIWTTAWLFCVTVCMVSSVLILFLTRVPSRGRNRLPYITLLHTVPLLTILTLLAAIASYIHVYLLQRFVQPVIIATEFFVPCSLLLSAVWAFVASFIWESGVEPTWGESTGLRLFSLVPLLLAVWTFRRLAQRLPRRLHTTSAVLSLTTSVLIQHPLLLILSPAVLLVALVMSIPFLTLIFRLLLVGHFTSSSSLQWSVDPWADVAIAFTVAIWLWSWAVVRGVLRVTTSAVVGAWYFSPNPSLSDTTTPNTMYPFSTETLHAALFRATGPSLGTSVLSALLTTLLRLLLLSSLLFKRLPVWLPFNPVAIVAGWVVGWIENAVGIVDGGRGVLIIAGMTGESYKSCVARRSSLPFLPSSQEYGTEAPFRLLGIAPLTLTLPFAILTYTFVAHTLGAPNEALGAAVLAGGTCALVGRFCVALVGDVGHALGVCAVLGGGRAEVREAFEYESIRHPTTRAQNSHPTPQPQSQSRKPQVASSSSLPPHMSHQQQYQPPQRVHPLSAFHPPDSPLSSPRSGLSPLGTNPFLPYSPEVPSRDPRSHPAVVEEDDDEDNDDLSPSAVSGLLEESISQRSGEGSGMGSGSGPLFPSGFL